MVTWIVLKDCFTEVWSLKQVAEIAAMETPPYLLKQIKDPYIYIYIGGGRGSRVGCYYDKENVIIFTRLPQLLTF